jgi:hypothetical protein
MWISFSAVACNQPLQPNHKHEGQKIMKGSNVIDIIERFQTHHALREEREMKNFHASTNGAVAPGVPDKSGMPKKSIPENEEVVIAEQPSLSQVTK